MSTSAWWVARLAVGSDGGPVERVGKLVFGMTFGAAGEAPGGSTVADGALALAVLMPKRARRKSPAIIVAELLPRGGAFCTAAAAAGGGGDGMNSRAAGGGGAV